MKTSGNQIEGFRKGVSVVVPVYNSEGMIRTLVERARAALDSIGREYELILVNDGSADGSWKKIREAAAEHGWITGINLMRNYGQHNALLCGVRKAQYSVTVTMDDDLQHPPEEIRKLIDKLDEGFDVVYGRPVVSKHSASRKLASRLIRLILRKATAERAASEASAFRAFRTVLRDAFEG
ncbi:MAG TPA: glycosyltransferase family 2 protein, partial [bacterium]|nr:glycosyltransferase family 2 protein [bacterium]